MKAVRRAIVGLVAVALGTWLLGWTIPAFWGVLVGVLWPRERPVVAAAVHGALGWGAILLLYAAKGYPVATLATRLAGAMQISTWLLFVATLVFPALLAASAAWLASALREIKRPKYAGP